MLDQWRFWVYVRAAHARTPKIAGLAEQLPTEVIIMPSSIQLQSLEQLRRPAQRLDNDFLQEVHKIAVLRANCLGDYIFSLPALQALRQYFPEAEIVLLGRKWHAEFLEGRPSPIDRVVVVPPIKGIYGNPDLPDDSEEARKFFDAMTQEHFDLAIQVHGDGRYSNPFIRRLGARLTIGSRMPEAQPLDLWLPYNYTQSEILRNLEIVSLVGAHAVDLEPQIYVTARDREEADQVFQPDNRPLVAINPGADHPRYRWEAEKFAAVGDDLGFAGARVVLVGQEDDQEVCEKVARLMITQPDLLYGRFSLNGMVGFLSQAGLMISNNSDYLRLAWAVGVPTVGIYWFGSLLTAGPLSRNRHRPAVSWRVSCPVCGLDSTRFTCDHTDSFMNDITVGEVLGSALELLSER